MSSIYSSLRRSVNITRVNRVLIDSTSVSLRMNAHVIARSLGLCEARASIWPGVNVLICKESPSVLLAGIWSPRNWINYGIKLSLVVRRNNSALDCPGGDVHTRRTKISVGIQLRDLPIFRLYPCH